MWLIYGTMAITFGHSYQFKVGFKFLYDIFIHIQG